MGKLNMGILGGFSGTVGTVVGSTNKNGDDIIRAKSKKSRPASSVGQVKQQTKFGLVTGCMQGLNPVLKSGMKQAASSENISPFNFACRYALTNAISGTDEQPELDYSKVIVSVGKLSRISGATAVNANGNIEFSWSDKVENAVGELTDHVSLVVFNVSNGELSYSEGEHLRSAKTATLPAPYSEMGDKLLFYLYFQSATMPTLVSTSQYLGNAVVA
ncbi:MAG: hypothetical protein GZ091_15440 [Paludibacter sp.]|nr:hypothetical protein [Paludibacter sp.]